MARYQLIDDDGEAEGLFPTPLISLVSGLLGYTLTNSVITTNKFSVKIRVFHGSQILLLPIY